MLDKSNLDLDFQTNFLSLTMGVRDSVSLGEDDLKLDIEYVSLPYYSNNIQKYLLQYSSRPLSQSLIPSHTIFTGTHCTGEHVNMLSLHNTEITK